MMRTLGIEVRRCFARRLVRLLIALAVIGCALTTFFSYRAASHDHAHDPFQLAELHQPHGDSIMGVAAFFLVIGGVVGGASMVGAEWRAGTFTTLLTWQPARRQVAVAKLLACGLVATGIAIVLQVLFVASFLPAALGPGTTEGVDAAWWRSVAGAGIRVACITGLVALLMASVAMVGRSTAAALGFAFGYMFLFENLMRAWKPWSARFLVGENGAVFITGDHQGIGFEKTVSAAGLTLTAYALVIALVAVVTFWRRDLASAS